MKEFSLKADTEDKGMRLDLFLIKKALKKNLSMSRQRIQKLILEGRVTLNNTSLKSHHKVKTGEVYKVIFQEQKLKDDLEPENKPIEIVYQDKDLALINKPHGLVVHPGAGNQNNTLVNRLIFHFSEISTINPQRPGIVHRLDKDTSGLMVIAKNDKSHLSLVKQFAKHSVKRQYVALVKGSMEFDENIIELPITRHTRDRKKMAIGFGNKSRAAKTHYQTLIRTKKASLLVLSPFTGRTHQLRVHLSFIGHPILGDTKYGKNNTFRRLALHATELGFLHPTTNKFIEFSTPMPEEFLNYFKQDK